MSLDLSATAKRLIARFGTPQYVELIRRTETKDIPTGQVTTTEQIVGLNAVVLRIRDELLDRSNRIQNGDKRVIMDNTVQPTMKDRLRWGGKEYQIIEIDGANPAGIQQYWDVICRG